MGRKNYQSAWWSVDLPSDWLAEKSDECTSFFGENGLGALQISGYRIEGTKISDEDLKELSSEELAKAVTPHQCDCGDFTGLSANFNDKKSYWRKWWLSKDDLMLYVTYNCDVENHGKEDDIVNRILNSLRGF